MLITNHEAYASDTIRFQVDWTQISPLPHLEKDSIQLGLAGAIVGTHSNRLIIAGGSNFTNNVPWRGGIKSFHDDIYILKSKPNNKNLWIISSVRLPRPLAYNACVSLPQGIAVIGGENNNGPTNEAFLITLRKSEIQLTPLPSLPIAISNAGATVIGEAIYVVGGMDTKGAVKSSFLLDLNDKNANWIRLPDLPIPLSHVVVISQYDGLEKCLFVLGGRNKISKMSMFYSTVWKYTPSSKIWSKVSEIKVDDIIFGLSAGTGVAFNDHYILLLGGDKGIIFNKTEQLINAIELSDDIVEKQKLLFQKDQILNNHPGFYRGVLLYNTLTNEWIKISDIPGLAQVTTTAVWWRDKVIVACGEIRPGVRTPNIVCVKISLKK